MKMHAIFGKKQIILASLVLILGIAVYLNWQFAKSGDDFAVTNQSDTAKNYGDAKLVNTDATSGATGSEYFTKARLQRQQTRDQAVEDIAKMLKDSKLDSKSKAEATTKAMELTKNTETEGKVENLIKAKGFKDCIAYLDGTTANIVVMTDGLTAQQAAQIKDIILSETKVTAENIKIVESK